MLYGGYAVTTPPLAGYCNDFAYPGGNNRVYAAILDRTHRFAACGYDKAHYQQTLEWVQVSDTSLADGSCSNTAGIPCVLNETLGYNVCGNLNPSLPYLQSPHAFSGSSFIHEIMHSFGINGNLDHFGTDVYGQPMGGDYGQSNPVTFQEWCGMCPNVYDNFVSGYVPCDSLPVEMGNCKAVDFSESELPEPLPNTAAVRTGSLDRTFNLTEVVLATQSDPWAVRYRYADPDEPLNWMDVDAPNPLPEGCQWSAGPGAQEGSKPHVHLFLNGEELQVTGRYCAFMVTNAWNNMEGDAFEAHANTCFLYPETATGFVAFQTRLRANVDSQAVGGP